MRRCFGLLASLLLSACAATSTAPETPAPESAPDPASMMLPETPKLTVSAEEAGSNLILISKRGEQEMDRLSVRKVRGLRFDQEAECLFDSPSNEVDFQIASLVVDRGASEREDDRDPVLYAVYGASKNDGKFKKFPKRAASCYFAIP